MFKNRIKRKKKKRNQQQQQKMNIVSIECDWPTANATTALYHKPFLTHTHKKTRPLRDDKCICFVLCVPGVLERL